MDSNMRCEEQGRHITDYDGRRSGILGRFGELRLDGGVLNTVGVLVVGAASYGNTNNDGQRQLLRLIEFVFPLSRAAHEPH